MTNSLSNTIDLFNTGKCIEDDNTTKLALLEENQNRLDKHIMISYHHKSAGSLARKINENLKMEGYKTWIDGDQMKGNIADAMVKGVDGSAVVLVLVTKEYCLSKNCIIECEYASRKGKYLIPITVEQDFKPSRLSGLVGLIVGGLLYVDFSNNDFENSFKHLLNQIKIYESSFPISRMTIISVNEDKSIKCINKKHTVSLLAIFMLLVTACILCIIIIAMKTAIKKRFCLITPQNEYIYYNGSGMWCHYNGNDSTQCYKQESSKDRIEGILLSNGNETIRLSELDKSTKDPQPKWKNSKWSKVWKKTNVDGHYFYPISNKTWVELQNDAIFAVFQLLDKEKDTFYLRKEVTEYFYKLTSNTLFEGKSVYKTETFIGPGEWV